MIGEMLLLCFKSSQGYRFEQVPSQADLHTIFTRHRLDAGYPLAAIASEHGGGLLVTESVPHQPRITVNRKPASQPRQTLRERDVSDRQNRDRDYRPRL
jgi:hypothetical protein